jgi:N-acyl-D-amino-acid deacylase
MIRRTCLLLVMTIFVGCAQEETNTCINAAPGFLITNVQVIDGSGSAAFAASVRIRDGIISEIGQLDVCTNETLVDGGGQSLAPGFIDTHSHADTLIFDHPDALSSVSQGITTVIVGQDGDSKYPLSHFYSKLDESPATVNFASYIGHSTLRKKVLGEDYKRVATVEEVALMGELLASELRSGALGFATGLEYDPGIYSETSEVISLAHVAAKVGGRYISHIRSEDRWFEDALD